MPTATSHFCPLTARVARILTAATLALAAVSAPALEAKWRITWTDYTNNPVDLRGPGSREYMPYVLHDAAWPAESRYRVWYDTESIAGLAHSFSADGLNWSPGVPLTGLNGPDTSSTGGEYAGRPVVLYNPEWPKPYRLYYYGRADAVPHPIWVAESTNGIAFENNRVALDPTVPGSRLGTYADGHAVAWFPGRNATPDDPEAARPFIMYFRDRGGQGIAYAVSRDGYVFEEPEDDPLTDAIEGLVELLDLEGNPLTLPMHPTQVLQLAQNDLRMFAFEGNRTLRQLVSANGLKWILAEDPLPVVGEAGEPGAWNDQRNYYASAAYLGEGRFFLMRGGRNDQTGLYRTGAAFGLSEFYRGHDLGRWSYTSPMNDWAAEGWTTFTTTGNEPDGDLVAVIQNADGTVSVRDRKESGNFYLRLDTAWTVPFTVEFRARLDDATGTGGDAEHPKYTVAAFQTDPDHPGGEAWQPAFAATRFGRWSLADDSVGTAIGLADNSQFQTYTFVCRFDESARALLATNPADGAANVRLCVFEVYLNRDFSKPAAVFNNTGFFGWDTVDYDGALDIGFPGPSAGQVTLDWVRWGNGVILDPDGPDAPGRPTLSVARAAGGLTVTWAGGTLESAPAVTGPWQPAGVGSSPAQVPADQPQQYFRVRR
jgi:hypothetical protein